MASRQGGWWLTIGALVAGLAAMAFVFHLFGTGEEGIRAAIRATARMSASVFALTFATSSLHVLARAGWSQWLLARRRYLGLGFAALHFLHLGVIVTLATRYPASFWAKTTMVTVFGGGFGYVLIAAMVATSFDGAPKRIGPRVWRALHKTGMYVVWAIFVFSYLGRARTRPLYGALFAALVLAFVARVVARLARRSRAAQSA